MKNLTYLLAVSAFTLSALSFQSCQKTSLVEDGGNAPIAIILKKHADSTLAVYRTFSGVVWKINSESVYPAINGSTVVTLDSCNTKVTYNFSALADSSYSVSGPITIHYFNSPCSAFLRGRNIDPDPKLNSYILNLGVKAVSTLTFADNGYDLVWNKYNIISSSPSALILQITIKGYTYTKTYLPVL